LLKNLMSAAVIATCLIPALPMRGAADAGAYLAARQAGSANDFASGARYFTQALGNDPSNPLLLESALTSYLALGQFDLAAPLAQQLIDLDVASQLADLTAQVTMAAAGDWAGLVVNRDQWRRIGPLIDGVSHGWALIGAGDITAGLAQFDTVIAVPDLALFGLTHKAYALASVGDFEGADALLSVAGYRYTRQSAIAHAEILSQLGRQPDALGLLDRVFGTTPDGAIAALRAELAAGRAVPYMAVADARAGLADLYLTVADLVQDDAPAIFTLIYARAAVALDPQNTPAILMVAGVLETLGQYDLANAAYAAVPRDDPSFASAELGRAEALRAAGRPDAAIEVLDALTRSNPDLADGFAAKGDVLRQVDRMQDAAAAYTSAIALYPVDAVQLWFVYFTRGIAQHDLDLWPQAEADFRQSLALRPNQPQVLNYLGYSLVERGEKLDEALMMIETAAAARPDSGAIIDSLGWVFFQLARYDEAVIYLEQAASLEPVDPVINDHLGDAYWAVGRQTEARFQWHRALSFDPTEVDAARIRDKLARGLDLVLRDEGKPPLQVARGDD
jgi:tetratricopeptide (TPR) repeat protein